jgi:tRNA A-37 threonylcarbamoyl transferase component Bud32
MPSEHTPLIEVAPDSGQADPEFIGRYRIVHRVGKGAFAQVYFVRDQESHAPFALKVLRGRVDAGLTEQIRVRFLAEANIARAIGHPAIVRIHETSAPGESPCFIAMEYVEGRPFAEHFRKLVRDPEGHGATLSRPEFLREVARLAHQIASAMTVAHEKGIVHRDLKPDNVLVTWAHNSGLAEIRIVDFGIAKAPLALFSAANAQRFTRYWTELGTVMGSPPYMAPEQNGAAHAVTGKADVYALGVMLAITACRLDREGQEQVEAGFMLPQDFDRIAEPGLPETWRSLLRSMVAADPAARPDMGRVARRLQCLAQKDERFGEAVEAWLEHGRVPRARRLVGFLNSAEGVPYLTPDEILFLKRAPVAKLRSYKAVTALSAGAVGLLVCSAVLTAALGWQKDAFARFRARAEAEQTEQARRVAELEFRAKDQRNASVPVMDDASREQKRLASLREALAAERAKANTLTRANEERQATVRSAAEQLGECNSSLERAEAHGEELASKLETGRKELAACRQQVDSTDQLAANCQRDLRAKIGQLDESTERLRLCGKSLKEQTDSVTPAMLKLDR